MGERRPEPEPVFLFGRDGGRLPTPAMRAALPPRARLKAAWPAGAAGLRSSGQGAAVVTLPAQSLRVYTLQR